MDEFVVWCAGFFDGEGCVVIPMGNRGPTNSSTHKQFWLQVSITQNIPSVLTPVKERFGGRVTPVTARPEKKLLRPIWRWIADGDNAATFLKTVRPYLRVKHRQADVGIRFQETMKGKRASASDVAKLAGVHRHAVYAHLRGEKVSPTIASAIEDLSFMPTRGVHAEPMFEIRSGLKAQLEAINNEPIWLG